LGPTEHTFDIMQDLVNFMYVLEKGRRGNWIKVFVYYYSSTVWKKNQSHVNKLNITSY